MSASVICTTHDRIDRGVAEYCATQLAAQCQKYKLDYIVMPQNGHYSSLAILTKMYAGLLRARNDFCYVVEHDVLYPDEYFQFHSVFIGCNLSYSASSYFLTADGFIRRQHPPLSSLCGYRRSMLDGIEELLREYYTRGKIKRMEFGLGRKDCDMRKLTVPFIDIRHGQNHTGERNGYIFDEVDGWGHYSELWAKMGIETKEDGSAS